MTVKTSGHEKLPLKQAVKHKVESENLEDSHLDELLTMQKVMAMEDHDSVLGPWAAKRFPLFSVASLLAFVVFSSALLFYQPWRHAQDIPYEIAQEVVQNHLKLKPLDLKANSMVAVKGFFTQLDFSPVNSNVMVDYFSLAEKTMLGGRYCSIKGVTAAQLRYQETEGHLSTLYEVSYDADLYGAMPNADNNEPPLQLMIKGLQVSMWLEKGLLMVLVRNE